MPGHPVAPLCHPLGKGREAWGSVFFPEHLQATGPLTFVQAPLLTSREPQMNRSGSYVAEQGALIALLAAGAGAKQA